MVLTCSNQSKQFVEINATAFSKILKKVGARYGLISWQ